MSLSIVISGGRGEGVHHVTDSHYDSPPQYERFSLSNVSWLLDTRKDTIEKKVFHIFSHVRRSNDQRRRGGKGHRISGDLSWSWF